MINIIKDRELIWETDKYDVILVGTSIYCMLSAGFQSKMKFKYNFLEPANDKTPYADTRKLGTRLTLKKNNCPIISLLYICNYPRAKKETIVWEAYEKCLKTANAEFKGMNIASTIIGSSKFDGNGDKERCLSLIKKYMTDVNITLYDYEQMGRREEMSIYRRYVKSFYRKDRKKFNELVAGSDEYYKSQYLK